MRYESTIFRCVPLPLTLTDESFVHSRPENQYGTRLSSRSTGGSKGHRRRPGRAPAATDTVTSQLRSGHILSGAHHGTRSDSSSKCSSRPAYSGGGSWINLRAGAPGHSVSLLPQLCAHPRLLSAQLAHPSDSPDSVPLPAVLLRVSAVLHWQLHEHQPLLWHVRPLPWQLPAQMRMGLIPCSGDGLLSSLSVSSLLSCLHIYV